MPEQAVIETTNWIEIREEYIVQNLIASDNPLTLKRLALLYGISYGTVRNKAAIEGWNNLLDKRREDQAQSAIARLQDAKNVFDEVEVRVRQARMAQKMSALALTKLDTVKAEDLTVKEAIELAKLGLIEERKALGIGDKYEFVGMDPEAQRERSLGVLEEVIKLVEEIEGTITVEPEQQSDERPEDCAEADIIETPEPERTARGPTRAEGSEEEVLGT